jgi:hypothetical protein
MQSFSIIILRTSTTGTTKTDANTASGRLESAAKEAPAHADAKNLFFDSAFDMPFRSFLSNALILADLIINVNC